MRQRGPVADVWLHGAARAAILAATLLACATSSRAETPAPTPAAIAAAREFVMARGVAASLDGVIAGMVTSAGNMYLPTNPNLKGPLDDVAAQLRVEFEAKHDELVTELAKPYARHFTEQELKEMTAIVKQPLVKRMLSEEGAALNDGYAAVQAWADKTFEQVKERFRVEMKKKGYDL